MAAAAIVDSVVDYIAVITSFTATGAGAGAGAGIVVAGADTAAAITVTVTRSITTAAAVSAIATWVYHRAYCGRSRSNLFLHFDWHLFRPILSAHCLGVKPSHYCMATIG